MITRDTVATETPASRATSLIVAIVAFFVRGKRLHKYSFRQKPALFKACRATCLRFCDEVYVLTRGRYTAVTRKSNNEKGESKPLVTLCEGLLRMFAGGESCQVVTLIIPEVLIGDVLQMG
ncbi:hypothetical protein A8H26_25060 [Pluralibacter gergoviae]|nr:hypothetical protein A8H26_25060 [Pluralibacter gergoviae]